MQDYEGMIRRLVGNDVEFVIVGGFAAVLHGSSLVTEDLDLCIPFVEGNLKRLLAALDGIHPEHRLIGSTRAISENAKQLCGLKNLYIKTDLGYLDFISEVGGVGGYEDARCDAVQISLWDMSCMVLNIDALIGAKKFMGRPRDKEAVVQLTAIKGHR